MKVKLDAYYMLANMMAIGVSHDVIETVLSGAVQDAFVWDDGVLTFAIFCSELNSFVTAHVDIMLNVYDEDTLAAATEIENGLRNAAKCFQVLNLSVSIWRDACTNTTPQSS